MSSADPENEERSTCSICGGSVPTRNLVIHETRCHQRRREPGEEQQPARRRPVVSIQNYNANYRERRARQRRAGSSIFSCRNFCILLGLYLGGLLLAVFGPLLMRWLRSLWGSFLLMLQGRNDFSVLEYYIRIWKPKPAVIAYQMFERVVDFWGIWVLVFFANYVWTRMTPRNNGQFWNDPIDEIAQTIDNSIVSSVEPYPILWGAWDMALMFQYYISTMKCLRGDGGACCSRERRKDFLHLFLDIEPPNEQNEEWMALSDDDYAGVRFHSNAWYVATYDYLAWCDFKRIVHGYDRVNYFTSGNVVSMDVYETIFGNMDDFVSVVESLEWKDEDKQVWGDIVQWNAYYQEPEDDIERGSQDDNNKITRKNLVGRIQCWDSVATYMHAKVPRHPGDESANEGDSSFTWLYHPEWNRETCGDAHEWRNQLTLRDWPVCMGEVVKVEKGGTSAGRRHTMIIGAAEDNLQCLVDEYQIWYDDCSSSWASAADLFGNPDLGPVQVAHLMKQYLDGQIHNPSNAPAYYNSHYRQSPEDSGLANTQQNTAQDNDEENLNTNEDDENAEDLLDSTPMNFDAV
mmetsp:Transcript_25573/g.62760  ORF Transcript_25573/g.62760 Transcript_25573/m.62760 type:complete len:574 (+) Transcript_25573:177-1898(+)|eukprot:CAMPEP_0113622322 /NCGR_PEP_ID=MMETSP0017_2-20120614/11433_1 /TAXON_ID=2856 /ORGANISM="Cylindrotheca closterium" /LENGTH=573 /DNA_ID=CAMNT_0000532139 /DNA_START=79 /DNA_END=1800 /DNA_ORIENTATION=- /assembly_acc=CAM_ASM_000147